VQRFKIKHKNRRNGVCKVLVTIRNESWPLAQEFRIARGAKTTAEVVTVTLARGTSKGHGECVPYGRYGESVDSVIAQIQTVQSHLNDDVTLDVLQALLPPGAARNALDCALWDLISKETNIPVWKMADLPEPMPLTTAYTISLDTPEAMAKAAQAVPDRPLLKCKIGGPEDMVRLEAIAAARPDARLILDANEGLDPKSLPTIAARARALSVELIEQPYPSDNDAGLEKVAAPVAICADESLHTHKDIERIARRYDAVNVKLDKTGGFTEALLTIQAAKAAGLKIMIGCMVGSSLAMAPAAILAGLADWVDLDGPLLLKEDRDPGLHYVGATMQPPVRALWG
jgi:L-alanine-DL-glutamate epimerase-like enolase superfamily enzyme